MTRFPRIRRLPPDRPLLAAGGIADGRTTAAALKAGQREGPIDAVLRAAEIVRRMHADAVRALSPFGAERLAA